MSIFRRKRVLYCGAIHPLCGYRRKRFRTLFRFPQRKSDESYSLLITSVITTAAFLVLFVRWWLGY